MGVSNLQSIGGANANKPLPNKKIQILFEKSEIIFQENHACNLKKYTTKCQNIEIGFKKWR
jgi:hypothetical protein